MERFGRYVLLEHVAQGGMAEVFRAAALGSAGFAKPLAVKRVLPHLAADPHFVKLLVDEAHIASQLSHPNVLQVLDLGDEKGTFFIAMEFVAGRSLNKVFDAALARGTPLPRAFVCHAMLQALHALEYVHAKVDAAGNPMKLIHRDVSPHNIMVAYDGSIKLADFGIAKVASINSDHTTGPIKGKPGYMSPEQVKDAVIDHRVDLYSAGVVLHELLAMRRLRHHDNPMRTLMEVAKGNFPRFNELGLDVPDDVAQVAYRALCVEPEGRWPDARSFGHALEAAARAHGWVWAPNDVATLMRELFPDEIAQELRTQTHFAGVVKALAQASTQDVTGILARLAPAENERTLAAAKPVHKVETPPTPVVTPPPPERRSGARWALLAALGVVGAVGVTQLRPVVATPVTTGALIIESTPPGARVRVNGAWAPGVTPLTLNGISMGGADVEVALDAHVTTRNRTTIPAGGTARLAVTLQPDVRKMSVTSEPAGATVEVAGTRVGTSPTTVELSGTEPVEVSLTLAGFAAVTQAITPARAPEALHITLVRVAPPPAPPVRRAPVREAPPPAAPVAPEPVKTQVPQVGRLTLQSTPWARIIIDGKDTGQFTPVADLQVPAGDHVIELVNDEEKLRTRFPVTVAAGASVRIARSLR